MNFISIAEKFYHGAIAGFAANVAQSVYTNQPLTKSVLVSAAVGGLLIGAKDVFDQSKLSKSPPDDATLTGFIEQVLTAKLQEDAAAKGPRMPIPG